MKALSACPDPLSLAAMLDQSLEPGDQEAVQEHVDQCPHCQRLLGGLVDDRVGEKLALHMLGADSERTTDHILQAATRGDEARETSRRSQPSGPAAAARPGENGSDSLSFLQPSDVPAVLGQLGHYEVLEILGRGGMGLVFKVRDTRLQRIVAIKALAPELAASATARKRFLREARAAAAVSHDHIITIYGVEEGPVPYLVMELIDGQSLQERMDQAGQLPVIEILRIGHQIAAGLAAAHAQGLIHRDIKPANILLQNGVQRVQITDFGLARAVDDAAMTRTGEVAGTPQYMSPEQAQGLPVDARSDLFSLGSVLYALCTGRSPFRAETTVAVLRRVCDDEARPIAALNSEIPAWLIQIVARLLAKEPDGRYQSAGEVAAELASHLARLQQRIAAPHEQVEPPIAKANGQAPGRPRRGWRWMGLAAILAAALGVLSVTEATQVTHLAGIVLRVVTGEGVILVEVDDPSIKVTIDGEEVVITEAGAKEIRVRAGKHKVAATKDDKPIPVEEEIVTIVRNGRRVVRVSLAAAAASGTPALSEQAPQPPRSAAHTGDPTSPTVASARPGKALTSEEARKFQQDQAAQLGVPVEFTNALGMNYRLIPPGQFTMGSSEADVAEMLELAPDSELWREYLRSEAPQHPVQLSEAWYLGVHEVTQGQYEAVIGSNPSYFAPDGGGASDVVDLDTANFPVELVSWRKATEFCNRLSERDALTGIYTWEGETCTVSAGTGYRLPTEAQWEFACRAGADTRYWFAPTGEELRSYGWYRLNAEGRTHPVGQLLPNPFGLHDLLGNVSEWCWDGWSKDYYASLGPQPAVDPAGPAGEFFFRMMRGASWRSPPIAGRSAARLAGGPNLRQSHVGLRVVLPVESVRRLIASASPPVASTESGKSADVPRAGPPP